MPCGAGAWRGGGGNGRVGGLAGEGWVGPGAGTEETADHVASLATLPLATVAAVAPLPRNLVSIRGSVSGAALTL
uniref:Uncharacterized protein n=1 Tax=Oryza sativa subsp. japonica TaxID=39947 RepID=Q6K4S5_ORYSJ|nr:hypothetical protein [Oryza sativa Japonica Group]BAD22207.1 hypothetical protein [Oryza sativa Japonica Group]